MQNRLTKESCESVGPAIWGHGKRKKLVWCVLVPSEDHENRNTTSVGTQCTVHYQSITTEPAASEQAVEQRTTCQTVVITQQVCVTVLVSLDLFFELRCLIPPALPELEPSRDIESLGGDR